MSKLVLFLAFLSVEITASSAEYSLLNIRLSKISAIYKARILEWFDRPASAFKKCRDKLSAVGEYDVVTQAHTLPLFLDVLFFQHAIRGNSTGRLPQFQQYALPVAIKNLTARSEPRYGALIYGEDLVCKREKRVVLHHRCWVDTQVLHGKEKNNATYAGIDTDIVRLIRGYEAEGKPEQLQEVDFNQERYTVGLFESCTEIRSRMKESGDYLALRVPYRLSGGWQELVRRADSLLASKPFSAHCKDRNK